MEQILTAESQPLSQLDLSSFSHEMRNLISLIGCELQMLSFSHPALSASEEWNEIICNLGDVQKMLEELSEYSNARRIHPQPTNLRAYLYSTLHCAKPALQSHGVTLEADLSDELPELPIDRARMRQALFNLLRNAREALSQKGGRILVRAYTLPDGTCISIEDNGCGMPPEVQKDIFLPFITHKPSGTGLGLAITKEIIEAHGGHVDVESTPGCGSIFRIILKEAAQPQQIRKAVLPHVPRCPHPYS